MPNRISLTAIALAAAVTACDRPVPTASNEESLRPAQRPRRASPSVPQWTGWPGGWHAHWQIPISGPTQGRSWTARRSWSTSSSSNGFSPGLIAGHSGSVARLSAESESAIQADAAAAIPLEIYFPVPGHRAAWTGGADILVASAREDHEAPVAYDVKGRRQVLSPDAPPSTPVLAIVPVETDFGPEGPVAFAVTPPPPPPPPPAPPPLAAKRAVS